MKRAQCSHVNARGTQCRSTAGEGGTCTRHTAGYVAKPRKTSADIAKRPPTNSLGESWVEGQTWTCTGCGATGPDRDDVRMPASCECIAPMHYARPEHEAAIAARRAARVAALAAEPDDDPACTHCLDPMCSGSPCLHTSEPPTDTVECPRCEGWEQDTPCERCGGKGRITAEEMAALEREQAAESTASAVSPEVNRPVAEGPVEAVDTDDAMLGAAFVDEVEAFQASVRGAHDHEADPRPSEPAPPIADREVKPSKAKRAKPAPPPTLPGLEGYAKRDVSLGQWDTHPEVARAFVRWCGVKRGAPVLEPSAGIGNIARALVDVGADVTCVELDADRAVVLRERGLGAVHVADFLTMTDGVLCAGEFDLAALNPPYENDGETRHLLHALTFAKRACGIVRLVALASASRAEAWRSVKLTRLAVLVPRPVFAGSSGMDEIAFVEIEPSISGLSLDCSRAAVEWLDWRNNG